MRCLQRFQVFWWQPAAAVPRHQAGRTWLVTRALIGRALCVATAMMLVIAAVRPVGAAEHPCAEEESAQCQAEKDERAALYTEGRNAYDHARESGDFSQALAVARKLAGRGDKNGERLLKMVYLQLGWGAHRDPIQAYTWLSEGIAGGADYLVRWRQILAEKMTAEDLAQAKKMAGN